MGPANPPSHLWLRVACNFDTDEAIFSWSADGRQFTPLGNPFTMTFQLDDVPGRSSRPVQLQHRPASPADMPTLTTTRLRNRAHGASNARFRWARPSRLTSGADGSFLAADTEKMSLVNVTADAAAANSQDTRFQVVDLGKGRVALKAANGRFVSAGEDGVGLKDLAGKTPGDAESFQWINLMRGDTMLMSLVNHRYLATQPNDPGPVTASATGPRPARKGGAEFKWKTVE